MQSIHTNITINMNGTKAHSLKSSFSFMIITLYDRQRLINVKNSFKYKLNVDQSSDLAALKSLPALIFSADYMLQSNTSTESEFSDRLALTSNTNTDQT